MSDVETSLKTTLEAHPQDWAIRWLVIDKMLERGAPEEAAELANAAPAAPDGDAQLHRLLEVGGLGSIGLIEERVSDFPADAYAHELYATLLDWAGKPERAQQHRSVAAALHGHGVPLEPVHGQVADEVEQMLEEQAGGVGSGEAGPEFTALPLPGIPEVPVEEAGEWVMPGSTKQTGSKVTAFTVAIAVHLLIALLALVVIILPPGKDEPEIVATIAPPSVKKQEMQKKNVSKQTKKTSASSAAAAPLAQLMRANASAKITMPQVTRTSTGPLGLGDADFGGGGFGSGGDGLGMGASFFGGSSTGRRFLFIIDHSGSMTAQQVKLRNAEVARALKSLRDVEYQVMLFAGGGYYAWPGWSCKKVGKRDNEIKGPDGTYRFISKGGYADYDFPGADSRLPKAPWLKANPDNVAKTMAVVTKHPLFGGTDWELALRIGHLLEPAPDVIFFMSDGTGGNSPPPILSFNAKHGKPVINTVAMQTVTGMKEFAAIARGTKGSFTIVDKKGKPIDGFEYQKNPEKFKGRL